MRRAAFVVLFVGIAACSAFGASSDEENPRSPSDEAGASSSSSSSSSSSGGEAGTETDAVPPEDAPLTKAFSDVVQKIPGLVAYWRLDEGATNAPTDVAGGNQGIYQPDVAPAPGLLPGDGDTSARRFTGGALSITSGDLSSLRTFNTGLTVGALVRVDNSLGADQMIAFKYNAFGLGIGSTGLPFLDVQRAGNKPRFSSNVTIASATTVFIVGSFDVTNGGSINLWVNNRLTSASGQTGLDLGPAAPNTETLCIGGATTPGNADCRIGVHLTGTIDELFIANKSIDPNTVEALTVLAGVGPP